MLVDFKQDTGADVIVIPALDYKKYFKGQLMKPSRVQLDIAWRFMVSLLEP